MYIQVGKMYKRIYFAIEGNFTSEETKSQMRGHTYMYF